MNSVAEIRHHIKVIEDTSKITRAMYLISSAKMKRAMRVHDQNMKFFDQVRRGIRFVLDNSEQPLNSHFFREHGKNAAYIVLAGDKSLCGGYNHQVLRHALEAIRNGGHGRVRLFTVGHMATEFFVRNGFQPDNRFEHVGQNPSLRNARNVTARLIDIFLSKDVDEVNVVYTMMQGATMSPTVLRIMPLLAKDFADVESLHEKVSDFTFYPTPSEVGEAMANHYLMGLVYSALAQSYAAENRARMTAMDNATRNAGAMLDQLRLDMNHVRQGAITQEITEIIAGAQQEGF
jgi:F-type H+-transporting ATPase subunit gamma